jgi:DNA-binding NarL/FixJ family response regulator
MISVFLVDDHELFLSGVRAELEGEYEVVGWASDVDEAIERIRQTDPDVVLVDVHMQGGGGLAVVANVLETHPEMRFLALSVSDAAEDVIAMISDAVFSPRLAGFVLDAFSEALPQEHDPDLDQLTNREKEVLRLIARGHAYKNIAKRLSISVKTVESHVSAVLRKLQLSSRYELARWASDRRIV